MRDIDPPAELERQVFPHAVLWYVRLTVEDRMQSAYCIRRLEKLENLPAQQRTIAAHRFLSLLLRLRRVVFKDCAFLPKRQPDHLLFRHELFLTDLYKAFAEKVVGRVQTARARL